MTKTDATMTLVHYIFELMSCKIGDNWFDHIEIEWKAAIELCFVGPNKAYVATLNGFIDALEEVREDMSAEDVKYLDKLIKRMERWR